MLSKRIIACLDVRDGKVVKGVNFESLRDAGDPATLARRYNVEGIDEIVILDVTATLESRQARAHKIAAVAAEMVACTPREVNFFGSRPMSRMTYPVRRSASDWS